MHPKTFAFATWLALAGANQVAAQTAHTLPDSLAVAGTSPTLTLRQGGPVFGEGVAADWQGNVYFNEMGTNNRTMRLLAGQDSSKPWRQAKDAPNGMWLDNANRLIICQTRAIVRANPEGTVFDGITDTLFKDTEAGAQDFNDVTGDSKNNLYFTNYNGGTVFFRDAATGATKKVLTGQNKPNGIEWDEERKIIYLNEHYDNRVAAYDVAADFTLTNRRDFGSAVNRPDGIALDASGNLFVASYRGGVHVFSPDARKLGEISVAGSQLTNLGFGGADFKTLFMITETGLYKLPMKVKGYKSGKPTVSLERREGATALSVRPPDPEFRMDGKRLHPRSRRIRGLIPLK